MVAGVAGTFLLGVGCQKGGTAWLHRYLEASPQFADGKFRNTVPASMVSAAGLPRVLAARPDDDGGQRCVGAGCARGQGIPDKLATMWNALARERDRG